MTDTVRVVQLTVNCFPEVRPGNYVVREIVVSFSNLKRERASSVLAQNVVLPSGPVGSVEKWGKGPDSQAGARVS